MRFSILLPTRNRREMLPHAIESVRGQSFPDWELVVYDNSEPSVRDVIPADPRIRYHHGPASGPAGAFQRALDLAQGEIVFPMGDDDTLPPDALQVIDAEIGEHEWLVGRTRCEDERGEVWLSGGPVDVAELEQVYYLGGAVCWKRSLTDRLGGFDLGFDGAADYDLYLRFARSAPAAFVDRVLYHYRDHPGTDSRRNSERQRRASERIAAA